MVRLIKLAIRLRKACPGGSCSAAWNCSRAASSDFSKLLRMILQAALCPPCKQARSLGERRHVVTSFHALIEHSFEQYLAKLHALQIFSAAFSTTREQKWQP